ncbi:MAG: hypothetical protein IJF73_06835 [Clostridia bacterium]|nr:hypothetical protein [Clostridia bacterium]
MNRLEAGYSRTIITPMVGLGISGYYGVRISRGKLDDLRATAVALRTGDTTVLLVSADVISFPTRVANAYREAIAAATGVPREAIFLHGTHTHTGPYLYHPETGAKLPEGHDALIDEYVTFLGHRLTDVCRAAIEDLAPARMGFCVGTVTNLAKIRRYRMKDGTVKTNPGMGTKDAPEDVLGPIGEVEERVSAVRFDREGKNDILLTHFGMHPDTISGYYYSADWPGFVTETLEAALPGVFAVVFNGAQGDVNTHLVDPNAPCADGMRVNNDPPRGYVEARYAGRRIAGAVLGIFDRPFYRDVEDIRFLDEPAVCPANKPRPEDLPEARRLVELHKQGRDGEIPGKGMDFVTVIAEACRMVALADGPDTFDIPMAGIAIGDVALVGIAGEPFTAIGRGIRASEAEGWELVLPCCCTNGSEGYFPMMDAYEEGGYESRTTRYRAGVGELLTEKGIEILFKIRK